MDRKGEPPCGPHEVEGMPFAELADYGIDRSTGFVPAVEPLRKLSPKGTGGTEFVDFLRDADRDGHAQIARMK
jgi:hypothetical protein